MRLSRRIRHAALQDGHLAKTMINAWPALDGASDSPSTCIVLTTICHKTNYATNWPWFTGHRPSAFQTLLRLIVKWGVPLAFTGLPGIRQRAPFRPQQVNPENQANRGLLSCPRQPRSLQGARQHRRRPGAPLITAAGTPPGAPEPLPGPISGQTSRRGELAPGSPASSGRRVPYRNGGWRHFVSRK
jgi:hypothetical protein